MQLLATAGGEVQIPYLIPYFWMKVWNLNFFSCQSRYRWKIVEATLNPNSIQFNSNAFKLDMHVSGIDLECSAQEL